MTEKHMERAPSGKQVMIDGNRSRNDIHGKLIMHLNGKENLEKKIGGERENERLMEALRE